MAKGVKYLKRTSKPTASNSRTSRSKVSILKPKLKPKSKLISDNNNTIDIDKHSYNTEDIDEDSDENQVLADSTEADSSEYETEPEEIGAIFTEVNIPDDSTE